MIYLFSGTPGSGKSLHAADYVRYNLKFRGPVIGTFHINKDCLFKKSKYEYTYVNIYKLTPDFLVNYAKTHKHLLKKHIESSFVVVIDEAQRIFNSRTWNDKDRNKWITFFAEHRHLGFDIILISQNDRMLDRQIRALIEYEFIHRKVSAAGLKGKILSLFVGNFCYVKYWYPIKDKLASDFYRVNKKLYDFYDSFEDFSDMEESSGSEDGGLGDPSDDPEDDYIRKLKTIEKITA